MSFAKRALLTSFTVLVVLVIVATIDVLAQRADQMTVSHGCRHGFAGISNMESPLNDLLGGGLSSILAPKDPTNALICRYFSDGTTPLTLYRSVALKESQARQLALDLDRIREIPRRGFYHCGEPVAGSYIDVFIFHSAHGSDVAVSHDWGSCEVYSNGHRTMRGPTTGSSGFDASSDDFVGPIPMPTCGPGMGINGKPAPCRPGVSPF